MGRPRLPARRRAASTGTVADERLPWDLLLISAAALILISVARLHGFVPFLRVLRPALLATGVAVAALLAGQRGARKMHYLATPLGRLMAFFVGWAVVTAPFAIYPGHSVKYLFSDFLREAVVILVVSASIRNLTDLKRLLAVYAYGVMAYSVLAAGTGAGHIGGGGYDANDSAMFVVSGMPLILHFLIRARGVKRKAFFAAGLAAAASAIVLSGSRGGFLALVAVMAYSLFFFKGVKKGARVAVTVVAAAMIAFSANDQFWARIGTIGDKNDYNITSYTGRKQVWMRGMGYMMQHPLTGVGIDDYSVAEGLNPRTLAMLDQGKGIKFSAAHSIWVTAGAELGIPGLLLLIAIFVRCIKLLWTVDRLSRPTGRSRAMPELQPLAELGRPLIGVLVGVFVAGTFLSRLYSSLLWLPIGLTLAVDKVGRMKEREVTRRALRPTATLATPGARRRGPLTAERRRA